VLPAVEPAALFGLAFPWEEDNCDNSHVQSLVQGTAEVGEDDRKPAEWVGDDAASVGGDGFIIGAAGGDGASYLFGRL